MYAFIDFIKWKCFWKNKLSSLNMILLKEKQLNIQKLFYGWEFYRNFLIANFSLENCLKIALWKSWMNIKFGFGIKLTSRLPIKFIFSSLLE